MVEHVRTRAYHAHVALQDVEELRQLVDIGLAHELAEGKLARVVLRGLHRIGILVDMHRTELQAGEGLAIDARALLAEEDGTTALKLNAERNDGDQRQEQNANHEREENVERALHNLVTDAAQRFVVVGENLNVTEHLGFHVQSVGTEMTGQIVEMNQAVVAEAHDVDDLLRAVVRQTAEQVVDGAHHACQRLLLSTLGDLLVQLGDGSQIAQPLGAVLHLHISIVALNDEAGLHIGELLIEFHQCRVVAHQQHRARVTATATQVVHIEPLDQTAQKQKDKKRSAEDEHELEQTARTIHHTNEAEHQNGLQQRKLEHLHGDVHEVQQTTVNYWMEELLADNQREVRSQECQTLVGNQIGRHDALYLTGNNIKTKNE